MERNFTDHPDYKDLPQPIKSIYSPKEYAWLGDKQREKIIENECYPEPQDDIV